MILPSQLLPSSEETPEELLTLDASESLTQGLANPLVMDEAVEGLFARCALELEIPPAQPIFVPGTPVPPKLDDVDETVVL